MTQRSDIYSLGLVLYELFTGRRPFETDTREELLRLQTQSTPQTPTSLVERLDPLVEHAILACLRPQPGRRPASPLQVAAMLPGGDPMQAALAAGDTPSPDAVAGAAAGGSVSPLVATAALVAVAGLLVVIMVLGGRTQAHRQIPLPLSPEQLSLRAVQVLALAGADTEDQQQVYGWEYDFALLRRLDGRERSPDEWRVARGQLIDGTAPPLLFWYQTSDQLEVADFLRPRAREFPVVRPGDTWVSLDPRGRLRELKRVPPARASAAADVDWRPLLAQTVAPADTLVPDPPQWRPPVSADQVYAWKARDGLPPIRIEAASAGGLPVWLAVLGPDEVPFHGAVIERPIEEQAFLWILITFYLSVIATAAVLGWRNARSGRGDRRGAFRFAAFVFVAQLLAWVVGGLHLASVYELQLFAQATAEALLYSAVIWLLFMALEPIIRRVWPQRLISWNRALIGSWRDPMVGRDVLAGTVAGLTLCTATTLQSLTVARDLGRGFGMDGVRAETLEGLRGVLFSLLGSTTTGASIVPFACLTFIRVDRTRGAEDQAGGRHLLAVVRGRDLHAGPAATALLAVRLDRSRGVHHRARALRSPRGGRGALRVLPYALLPAHPGYRCVVLSGKLSHDRHRPWTGDLWLLHRDRRKKRLDLRGGPALTASHSGWAERRGSGTIRWGRR